MSDNNSKQQSSQRQQQDAFAASSTAPPPPPHPSVASPTAYRIFLGLLYMFLATIILLVVIELPMGPVLRAVKNFFDASGEARAMCSNCTYLVNRLDLIAHRSGMLAKKFDTHVKTVCPPAWGTSSSSTNGGSGGGGGGSARATPVPLKEKSGAARAGSGGGGGSLSLPTLCHSLVVYYRERLRARFRAVVAARKQQAALQSPPTTTTKGGSSGSGGDLAQQPLIKVVAASDFCSLHCRSGASSLFERYVLSNVEYFEDHPDMAAACVLLRNYGRLALVLVGCALVLAMILRWRQTAAQKLLQLQETERLLVHALVERNELAELAEYISTTASSSSTIGVGGEGGATTMAASSTANSNKAAGSSDGRPPFKTVMTHNIGGEENQHHHGGGNGNGVHKSGSNNNGSITPRGGKKKAGRQ